MLSMIVAHDLNRGIGFENKLLCSLKDDMRLFKEVTTGKTIVMGRKTFDSIGKLLPNRRNIIMTTDFNLSDKYMTPTYKDIESFMEHYELAKEFISNYKLEDKEIVVIGGASIYEQFLPYIDRLYITEIQNTFDKVDSYFPKVDFHNFKTTHTLYKKQDENNEYDFIFKIYDKYNK